MPPFDETLPPLTVPLLRGFVNFYSLHGVISQRGYCVPLSRAACAPELFDPTVGWDATPSRAIISPCEEFGYGKVICGCHVRQKYPRACGVFPHTSEISVPFHGGGGGQKTKERWVTADGRRSVEIKGGDTSWCSYSCRPLVKGRVPLKKTYGGRI